jgi:hypothetical protein
MRRLEDVYLSIVADERVERGAWSADDSQSREPTTDDKAIRDTQYAAHNTAHSLTEEEEISR